MKKKRRAKKKMLRKLRKMGKASPNVATKLNLRLPPQGIFDEWKLLNDYECGLVTEQLEKNAIPVAQINEMFVAT